MYSHPTEMMPKHPVACGERPEGIHVSVHDRVDADMGATHTKGYGDFGHALRSQQHCCVNLSASAGLKIYEDDLDRLA